MRVLLLKVTMYAPWAHSLKEKRMMMKSLLAKLRNKFNVSAAEIEKQDTHSIMVIAIASIAAHSAQADSIAENIIHFIELNTESEITKIEKEFL